MPRAVHFGAFDAEPRWRPTGIASLPELRDSGAQRMVGAMEELHWGFAAPGDVVLSDHHPVQALGELLAALGVDVAFQGLSKPDVLQGASASPWAVVPGVHELVARRGLVGPLPSVEVTARVNTKTFSNALAESLGLEGVARRVTSTVSLEREVGARLASGAAVVKDPYGVSGRGAVVVSDAATLVRLLAHLQRQEERGQQVDLLVQPLYQRAADYSCHFELGPDTFRPLGVQEMLNQGMAFQCVREPGERLLAQLDRARQWEVMEAVASALREAGYRGPVCVDAMLLADGRSVPLLEINARKSMGLLHLRLRRLFELSLPSELVMWPLVLRRQLGGDEVLATLRESGVLFNGERGFLPLAMGPLLANAGELGTRGTARGRLYALLAYEEDSAREALQHGARAALVSAGAIGP